MAAGHHAAISCELEKKAKLASFACSCCSLELAATIAHMLLVLDGVLMLLLVKADVLLRVRVKVAWRSLGLGGASSSAARACPVPAIGAHVEEWRGGALLVASMAMELPRLHP
jgi:hypothetical protein